MKFNITGIYLSIMIPLALGFIQSKKEKGEEGGFYPLLFLSVLAFVNLIKDENIWQLIYFYVRGLFL